MNLTIDPEFAALIPALRPDERAGLEASLLAEGCRDPLVTWHGTLLDGHHRYAICTEHGIDFAVVEREFADSGDARIWCLRNQGGRRNLSDDQRAMLAIVLQEALSEQAVRERAKTARAAVVARNPVKRADPDLPHDACGKSGPPPPAEPPAPKRDTRAEAGAALGVTRGRVQQAKALAKARPDLAEQVASGGLSIREARGQARQAKKRETAARIDAEPTPSPKGPFRVIVADPPWKYEKRVDDITHRARLPYPEMDTAAICALPVGAMAHEDCILWLWTTNAFMRDAYAVLDAWGFRERTILTWVKDRMGTGDWLRGKTEHCILAIRGRPTVCLTNQTTVIPGPVREHSRKPNEFYALVEALCPGSKVELFSRETRKGWGSWGAEVGTFNA